uniref:Transmembrane 6 superfamily member 2a n=1 Tax=Paramormyrops kingsleyae TaxID=1676925 RepID=A0A3B3SBI4_9TELE|nr:transmembrane 6 superfamily member 2 isoform X1 [Paramormyrops kingsleyae]XP_023653771.1 transmembrane 6 superfamily member 2 isoform X1 [Paramormyrops kingsleyae]XP_023653772.1 transmembrane 6 superfamily member 2 isoform X1 [Paramormyrops kingsleyae]
MKMKIYQEICVFFVSLSAPVLLYVMNNVPTFHEPFVILGTGLVVSGAVSLLAFLSAQRKQPKDILFYVCVQFAFTSVLKLTNALEQDGFTSGFVGFYQRKGEPCMVTAYAIMMCYWDGVVHFLLYLLLLHHRAKAKLYRGMGLFWAGSSFASMSVFIPGSVIGKYGSNIYPAFWLNVLLLLGSVWVAASLLSSLRELPVVPADEVESVQRKTLLTRPTDLLLMTFLLGAMVFTVFRGLVVLDCPLDSCFNYIYQYEPYLKDPVGYPRVMMLVYLFYGLPLMAAFVYGLVTPGCTWMLDWTVLFAGFMAQAQWCHISASLHPRTPYTYRIPEEKWQAVLLANLGYVTAPLLLGLRCIWSPAFFMKTVPPGQVTKEKKSD